MSVNFYPWLVSRDMLPSNRFGGWQQVAFHRIEGPNQGQGPTSQFMSQELTWWVSSLFFLSPFAVESNFQTYSPLPPFCKKKPVRFWIRLEGIRLDIGFFTYIITKLNKSVEFIFTNSSWYNCFTHAVAGSWINWNHECFPQWPQIRSLDRKRYLGAAT